MFRPPPPGRFVPGLRFVPAESTVIPRARVSNGLPRTRRLVREDSTRADSGFSGPSPRWETISIRPDQRPATPHSDPDPLRLFADRRVSPTAPTAPCPGRESSARADLCRTKQAPRPMSSSDSPRRRSEGPLAPLLIWSDVISARLSRSVGFRVPSAPVCRRRGVLHQDELDPTAQPRGELPTDLDGTGSRPERSWRIGQNSRSWKSVTIPIRAARPWWGRDARFRLVWRLRGPDLLHRPEGTGLPRLCLGAPFAGAPGLPSRAGSR